MDPKKAALINKLNSAGWTIEGVEESDLEWWADEIWTLRSTWSPIDFVLYLTFLVDPMHDGPRRKGEAVWAIGASKSLPTDRTNAEGDVTVSIKNKFDKKLPAFVEEIGELRGCAA